MVLIVREIKFRVWDGEKMNYGEQGFIWESDGSHYQNIVKADVDSREEKFEVMQYTGLKDKEANEIYECDIVETWGKTKVVKYDKEKCRFALVDSEGKVKEEINKVLTTEYLVIGNKHENQELLN